MVGVAAAIIGDNLGYWTARKGGRPLLERHRLTRGYAERYLPRGERFFARHGGKAVFLGRFVAVLRVTAAWIAGITLMRWWRFLLWNAAGGIVWATAVELLAYWSGKALADAIQRDGIYAAAGLAFALGGGWLAFHLARRRLEQRL
jgi:membrane protein DedA with SNARE-associated domain